MTNVIQFLLLLILSISAYATDCNYAVRTDCFETSNGWQYASGYTITNLVLKFQNGAYDTESCAGGNNRWGDLNTGNVAEDEDVYTNIAPNLVRVHQDNGQYHRICVRIICQNGGTPMEFHGTPISGTPTSSGCQTCSCAPGFSGANCQTIDVTLATTVTAIRATFTDLNDRLVAFKASAEAKVTPARIEEIKADFKDKPKRQKRERIKASKVVLAKQDLPPIYSTIRKKMKSKIAIVAVEYDKDDPDCDGVEQDSDGIPNCCSYDMLQDTDTSVIVGTYEKVGAWSVLCEGTTVISKQTRTTLTNANGIGTYTMQCWNGAAFGNAVATQSGQEHTCGDYLLLIGSQTGVNGSNVACLHPDVPVHVLRGASVETVKVATLEIGDLVIGEGKTSTVQRVEHFKVDDEACVVPQDLCGGFADHVVVSKNHAVRCPSWPANTWTFCQPEWQRVATTKYVHVVLESYIDDHVLSGSVVLESWDGYSRNTDSIEEACGQRGCPWPHKWVSVGENRWTRQDLRTTLVDSTPRLRLTLP